MASNQKMMEDPNVKPNVVKPIHKKWLDKIPVEARFLIVGFIFMVIIFKVFSYEVPNTQYIQIINGTEIGKPQTSPPKEGEFRTIIIKGPESLIHSEGYMVSNTAFILVLLGYLATVSALIALREGDRLISIYEAELIVDNYIRTLKNEAGAEDFIGKKFHYGGSRRKSIVRNEIMMHRWIITFGVEQEEGINYYFMVLDAATGEILTAPTKVAKAFNHERYNPDVPLDILDEKYILMEDIEKILDALGAKNIINKNK